jgi:hypothetical protein
MRTTNERVWAGLQNNAINLRIIEIEARGGVATCAHTSVLVVQAACGASHSRAWATLGHAGARATMLPCQFGIHNVKS